MRPAPASWPRRPPKQHTRRRPGPRNRLDPRSRRGPRLSRRQRRRPRWLAARLSAGRDPARLGHPAVRCGRSSLRSRLQDWLAGGNALVRTGIVVLFFGAAFLVRYVAEHSQLSIELRLAALAATGIAGVALGWRLRERRRGYALSLQGGGLGLVYLVLYGAMQFYGLIRRSPVSCCCSRARQPASRSRSRRPPRCSGCSRCSAAFSRRCWSRPAATITSRCSATTSCSIRHPGAAAARAVAAAGRARLRLHLRDRHCWGGLRYRPELLASTEPFLLAFFGLFSLLPVLVAHWLPPDPKRPLDAGLAFGVPVLTLALQAALLEGVEHGLALSALGCAAWYAALGVCRQRPALALLGECQAAIARWCRRRSPCRCTSRPARRARCGAQGAGLVLVGARQDWRGLTGFGALLLFAAGRCGWTRTCPICRCRGRSCRADALDTPLLALAALVAAAALGRLRRHRSRCASKPCSPAGGVLVAAVVPARDSDVDAGGRCRERRLAAVPCRAAARSPSSPGGGWRSAGCACRCTGCRCCSRRWPCTTSCTATTRSPASALPAGWRRSPCSSDCCASNPPRPMPVIAAGAGATRPPSGLALALALQEVAWLISDVVHLAFVWLHAANGVLIAATLALLLDGERLAWLLAAYGTAGRWLAGAPVALLLLAWFLVRRPARPGAAGAAAVRAAAESGRTGRCRRTAGARARGGRPWFVPPAQLPAARTVLAALGFATLNLAVLRACHHLAGVPWSAAALCGIRASCRPRWRWSGRRRRSC